jgi:hypothetical protein
VKKHTGFCSQGKATAKMAELATTVVAQIVSGKSRFHNPQ